MHHNSSNKAQKKVSTYCVTLLTLFFVAVMVQHQAIVPATAESLRGKEGKLRRGEQRRHRQLKKSKKDTPTPTASPSQSPTPPPTASPTRSPTQSPTDFPTLSPTRSPTQSPTAFPTASPTTGAPTESPSVSPTFETPAPSPSPIVPGCPCWDASDIHASNIIHPEYSCYNTDINGDDIWDVEGFQTDITTTSGDFYQLSGYSGEYWCNVYSKNVSESGLLPEQVVMCKDIIESSADPCRSTGVPSESPSASPTVELPPLITASSTIAGSTLTTNDDPPTATVTVSSLSSIMTNFPTASPTQSPTAFPTASPTGSPTQSPTDSYASKEASATFPNPTTYLNYGIGNDAYWFIPNVNVELAAIGMFDWNQDGLRTDSNATVALYVSETEEQLVSVTISGTEGFIVGAFRYKAVDSFMLSAGTEYVIVSNNGGNEITRSDMVSAEISEFLTITQTGWKDQATTISIPPQRNWGFFGPGFLFDLGPPTPAPTEATISLYLCDDGSYQPSKSLCSVPTPAPTEATISLYLCDDGSYQPSKSLCSVP